MTAKGILDFHGFFLFKSLQDSSNSVRQTKKTTAGEAGVHSRGGEEQKGNVQSAVVVKAQMAAWINGVHFKPEKAL